METLYSASCDVPNKGYKDSTFYSHLDLSKCLTHFDVGLLSKNWITHLIIDFNDITELPKEFGHCLSKLEIFSADGNKLSTLPDSVTDLANLQELSLRGNELETLPSRTYKNLKSLKKLHLSENFLTLLPYSFGEMEYLEVLEIDDNGLDKLPPTFGLLKNLRVLDASNNSLLDIPNTIKFLVNLQIVNFSLNSLTSLPESLGDLRNLESVEISHNRIKELPIHFQSVHKLKRLFADNNLLLKCPNWFAELTVIEELSIQDNRLRHMALGRAFGSMCKLLKYCDLRGNYMDALPPQFGEASSMEFLHLGSILKELERRNFQNGNSISYLPESFCQLTALKELHVDENQLYELPEHFGNLVSLELLDAGQNMLTELPRTFGNLQSLKTCLLSRNHITLLPSDIGRLFKLEELRLDNNELAELPESFSELQVLKILDLYNNKLVELPSCLQQLTRLKCLDLSENNFDLPFDEVPSLLPKSSYAPRDTSVDNWRGRSRVQNLNTTMYPSANNATNREKDSSVLLSALRHGSSLWQSHDGPNNRKDMVSRKKDLKNSDEDSDFQSEKNGEDKPGNIANSSLQFEENQNKEVKSSSSVMEEYETDSINKTLSETEWVDTEQKSSVKLIRKYKDVEEIEELEDKDMTDLSQEVAKSEDSKYSTGDSSGMEMECDEDKNFAAQESLEKISERNILCDEDPDSALQENSENIKPFEEDWEEEIMNSCYASECGVEHSWNFSTTTSVVKQADSFVYSNNLFLFKPDDLHPPPTVKLSVLRMTLEDGQFDDADDDA